jgi:hypothetical protein
MTIKPVPPQTSAHPSRNKDLKTLAALIHAPAEDSAQTEQAKRQTSTAFATLRARLKDVLMASTNPLVGKQGAQIRQRILREIVRADLPNASVNHPDLASVVEEIEQYIQSDPLLQEKLAKAISTLQR